MAARATLSGLTNNTTYHYRLVATNAAGVARGADKSFKTAAPASAPSISSRRGDRRELARGDVERRA